MITPINPTELMTALCATLELPEQKTTKLGFCDSSKLKHVRAWAEKLKVTQAVATSVLLYRSIPELSHLKTTYRTRLDMLEVVRARLKTIHSGLSKEYLKKPIILPPEAQKAAIIAQAIQKHLLNGYLIALQDCLASNNKSNKSNKKNITSSKKDIALIIYRSMHAIQTIFFRSYQLYTRYPHNLWKTLHTLYLIGDHFDLLNIQIEDNLLCQVSSLSIKQTYVRTLLLSASKPNQISQGDITSLYSILEQWCQYADVQTQVPQKQSQTNILCVDLNTDNGPIYKPSEPKPSLIEICIHKLINEITKDKKEEAKIIPLKVTPFIQSHALNAWTQTTERLDQRNPTNAQADICIGLSDCHKLLAQGENFQNFIENDPSNSNLDQKIDSQLTPNTQFDNAVPSDIAVSGCTVVNTSQNGFCLLWQGDIPSKMQAGEILLIRERSRHKWKLGVVRWIKQLKNASQLGIQVIANDPIPAAVKQVSGKRQQPDYQRALLTQQQDKQTLLCPSNLFTVNKKANIIESNRAHLITIEQNIYSTSNIAQYTYDVIPS